jgi:hypothetical protein
MPGQTILPIAAEYGATIRTPARGRKMLLDPFLLLLGRDDLRLTVRQPALVNEFYFLVRMVAFGMSVEGGIHSPALVPGCTAFAGGWGDVSAVKSGAAANAEFRGLLRVGEGGG